MQNNDTGHLLIFWPPSVRWKLNMKKERKIKLSALIFNVRTDTQFIISCWFKACANIECICIYSKYELIYLGSDLGERCCLNAFSYPWSAYSTLHYTKDFHGNWTCCNTGRWVVEMCWQCRHQAVQTASEHQKWRLLYYKDDFIV